MRKVKTEINFFQRFFNHRKKEKLFFANFTTKRFISLCDLIDKKTYGTFYTRDQLRISKCLLINGTMTVLQTNAQA